MSLFPSRGKSRSCSGMYSGLLPKGLSEADLSSSEEEDNTTIENKVAARRLDEGVSAECSEGFALKAEPTEHGGGCEECPSGVSLETWQKFKNLQKKKEETVNLMVAAKTRRRRKHHKKGADFKTQSLDSEKECELRKKREQHWEGLKQYFGVNDRFQPPACSKHPAKSGLEESIESAIAEGDYGTAEDLSDRLATRELAVKIAHATDCRDFVQTKQEAEASRATQKRKQQVAWGFEAKKRWETKSNMGFM
ncbi:protein FAM204A [Denticeps clupeoides]|uniref:Family with sequence similarity 204 member A n=1 Tax=Denticeps clupeoides TaxID=299321 RepID=A0AAY4EN44_9TELE|nr:protein FAM204A [Denticeps clupeoides]